jgi:phage terminase large subunit-like protein
MAAGGTRWAAFHFTSRDNPHISQAAVAELAADMTQQSIRQEIEAEDLDDVPGALWTRANLDETRVATVPELVRVVVGVDPSATAGGDMCGIVVVAEGSDGHGYVLDDRSLQASPSKWAHEAVAAYHRHEADRLIAESNNGGEMVALTIKTIPGAPLVRLVHASRGKITRAEPIAALSEQKRLHMVGTFPALEDELVSYDGTGASPNRLDAFVWAASALNISPGMTRGMM